MLSRPLQGSAWHQQKLVVPDYCGATRFVEKQQLTYRNVSAEFSQDEFMSDEFWYRAQEASLIVSAYEFVVTTKAKIDAYLQTLFMKCVLHHVNTLQSTDCSVKQSSLPPTRLCPVLSEGASWHRLPVLISFQESEFSLSNATIC